MPAKTTAGAPDAAAQKTRILARAEQEKVKFLRLQFTDILGTIKNVEIPDRQFEDALNGEVMFDGSSIEGFVRIEESDMYLRPDLDTFAVFPWANPGGEKVARMICDIARPDGQPFEGCPRSMLKRVIGLAAERGFAMNAGPEAEFFLFQRRNGAPTTDTHDTGSYFDLTPVDQGRTSGVRSCWRSKRWASTSRRRTTRSPPASTRSTSATTTCWRRPTTSRPSGSS